MSISSSGTRKSGPFTGDGSTATFPFTFKVFQAADLLVVQTDATPTDHTLVLNTDYTVALNANQDANPGGTVNMTVVPPAGFLLTIGSNVPELQSVTLTNNGGFYPTVINAALDYLTILIQQLSEKVGRALVMPFSTNASGQLPPVAPGQLLGWKADGSGIDNVGASGVGAGSIVPSNMAAGATGTALSSDTQAAAAKTAPADADGMPLFDSAAAFSLRRLTWANFKATVASLLNMTGAVNEARTTVASTATPDIWTGAGNIINYTGTATATGFAAAPQAGARRVLDCAAACSFTAGANMLIDGVSNGGNLTVSAGDRVEVLARTATEFVMLWHPAQGNDTRYASAMFPFAPSASTNALGGSLGKCKIDFRNGMLTTGTPLELVISSALSLPAVPATSSLGTTSGELTRLVYGVAYNGGTAVTCIANPSGGLVLDGTALVTPATIGAASNGSDVVYSASSVSANSPFTPIGYIDATWTSGAGWAITQAQPASSGLIAKSGLTIYTPQTTPLLAAGNGYIVNHSLGVVPIEAALEIVCLTAEGGYSIGDVVQIQDVNNGGGTHLPATCWKSATQVGMPTTAVAGAFIYPPNKTAGAVFTPTAANWAYRFRLRTA